MNSDVEKKYCWNIIEYSTYFIIAYPLMAMCFGMLANYLGFGSSSYINLGIILFLSIIISYVFERRVGRKFFSKEYWLLVIIFSIYNIILQFGIVLLIRGVEFLNIVTILEVLFFCIVHTLLIMIGLSRKLHFKGN